MHNVFRLNVFSTLHLSQPEIRGIRNKMAPLEFFEYRNKFELDDLQRNLSIDWYNIGCNTRAPPIISFKNWLTAQ